MRSKRPRSPRKKPLSIIAVLVATGEAISLTPLQKAQLIRGTCDLLEEQADQLDPPQPFDDHASK